MQPFDEKLWFSSPTMHGDELRFMTEAYEMNWMLGCTYFLAYPWAWLVHALTLGKMDFHEKVQRLCEPRAYSHEAAPRILAMRR